MRSSRRTISDKLSGVDNMSKRKHISESVRREVIEKYNATCVYCEKEGLKAPNADKNFRAAIDHIVSLHEGGSNELSNLQLLCTTCNVRKGTMSMSDFVAYMERREETDRMARWLAETIPDVASALPYILEVVPHDRKYALLKPIYDYINDNK